MSSGTTNLPGADGSTAAPGPAERPGRTTPVSGVAGRPMTLWRLEWLRLFGTPRAIALGAVFVAVGLLEPLFTRYEDRILAHVGGGARISAPPPTPADGLSSYASEIFLVGLIVVVVLAAGPFTFDASPGLSTFLRTRVTNFWNIVGPRFTISAAAAAVAYLLGTLAACYETRLLIGSLPAAAVLGGALCGAVYFMFAIAVTALAASLVRGRLAVVGTALAMLLVLPAAGLLSRTVADWLPSALVSAPVSLVNGSSRLGHYLPPLLISVAAGGAALALAVSRLSRREV
jgi:ABC-2 type transport system permease protein